jgi:N-acetylglutamate synthase-like GNAT family acetyltransferase
MTDLDDLRLYYGIENVDFDKLTAMLSSAYWSPGIRLEDLKKAAENSAVVVSAYINGEQIGFCRAVSDKTRFAYIMDVFVDERYRRRGIGQKMLNFLIANDELKSVYQWFLLTKYAHGFYKKLGFQDFSRPNDILELPKNRPNT